MNQIIRFYILVSCMVLLSACAARPLLEEQSLTQSLPLVEQPDWTVGYRQFSIDNQTGDENSWEILSIDDEGQVTAKSSDGCMWTVSGEWFAGVERWENCGGGNGTRKLLSSEGTLWPLKVGNRSSYRYEMQSSGGKAQNERVKCNVASEGRVTVAMGELEVFRVECVRSNEWSVQTRTWYWAPEVGEVKFMRYDSKRGVLRNIDVIRSEQS